MCGFYQNRGQTCFFGDLKKKLKSETGNALATIINGVAALGCGAQCLMALSGCATYFNGSSLLQLCSWFPLVSFHLIDYRCCILRSLTSSFPNRNLGNKRRETYSSKSIKVMEIKRLIVFFFINRFYWSDVGTRACFCIIFWVFYKIDWF